jgi:hypothetical protein
VFGRSTLARCCRALAFGAVLLCLLVFCSPALGQGFSIEIAEQAPANAPDWLAEKLRAQAIAIADENGALGTLWLPATFPSREDAGEFGVDFGHFPIGALIGYLELAREWVDYRKQPVKPGHYTLRYGVQPSDGDHTGQTYFRDFLMLLPIEGDIFRVEGGTEQEPIAEAATVTTGTEHPAVMAMYQIYDPVEAISVVLNDYDEPCLAVPIEEDVVLGLVLDGHGQELPV